MSYPEQLLEQLLTNGTLDGGMSIVTIGALAHNTQQAPLVPNKKTWKASAMLKAVWTAKNHVAHDHHDGAENDDEQTKLRHGAIQNGDCAAYQTSITLGNGMPITITCEMAKNLWVESLTHETRSCQRLNNYGEEYTYEWQHHKYIHGGANVGSQTYIGMSAAVYSEIYDSEAPFDQIGWRGTQTRTKYVVPNIQYDYIWTLIYPCGGYNHDGTPNTYGWFDENHAMTFKYARKIIPGPILMDCIGLGYVNSLAHILRSSTYVYTGDDHSEYHPSWLDKKYTFEKRVVESLDVNIYPDMESGSWSPYITDFGGGYFGDPYNFADYWWRLDESGYAIPGTGQFTDKWNRYANDGNITVGPLKITMVGDVELHPEIAITNGSKYQVEPIIMPDVQLTVAEHVVNPILTITGFGDDQGVGSEDIVIHMSGGETNGSFDELTNESVQIDVAMGGLYSDVSGYHSRYIENHDYSEDPIIPGTYVNLGVPHQALAGVGAYSIYNTEWARVTYSRLHANTYGLKPKIMSGVYNFGDSSIGDESGPTQHKPVYQHEDLVCGNGKFVFKGGGENYQIIGYGRTGGGVGDNNPTEMGVTFTDVCGKQTLPISNNISNVDDVPRTGLSIIGVEFHSFIENMPYADLFDPAYYTYTFDGVSATREVYYDDNHVDPEAPHYSPYIDVGNYEDVVYNGKMTIETITSIVQIDEEFIDLPKSYYGDFKLATLPHEWTGTYDYENPGEDRVDLHFTPDGSGEPSHPSWLPLPEQLTYQYDDPPHVAGDFMYSDEGEPVYNNAFINKGIPWSDDHIYLTGNSDLSTIANAITITATNDGDIGSPQVVFKDISTWPTKVNCTGSTVSGDYQIIITGTTPSVSSIVDGASDILSKDVRLTGTRFAKVRWRTDSVVGSATTSQVALTIGVHTWNLYIDFTVWEANKTYQVGDLVSYGSGSGNLHECTNGTPSASWDSGNWTVGADIESMIDLCAPDVAGVAGGPVARMSGKTLDYAVHSENALEPIVPPIIVNGYYIHAIERIPCDLSSLSRTIEKFKIHYGNYTGTVDEYQVGIACVILTGSEIGTDAYGVKDSIIPNSWSHTEYEYSEGFEGFDGDEFEVVIYYRSSDINPPSSSAFNYLLNIDKVMLHGEALVDTSLMQSIIPFEAPLDLSYDMGYEPDPPYDAKTGRRNPDPTAYGWDYPAGWGVGRITSIVISPLNDVGTYSFKNIQLYKKLVADGGFTHVHVLHFQPSWNDTHDTDDFAYAYAGTIENIVSSDSVFSIRKAVVIVDGAIILEIPAGHCKEDNKALESDDPRSKRPYYIRKNYDLWNFGNKPEAYPIQYEKEGSYEFANLIHGANGTENNVQYTPDGIEAGVIINSVQYACNDVISISSISDSSLSDYQKSFALMAFLVGGIYIVPSGGSVSIGIQAYYDRVYCNVPIRGIASGVHKRYRGRMCGLAYNLNNTPASGKLIKIYTPNSTINNLETDAVYATTNSLGWWVSPALSTKNITPPVGDNYDGIAIKNEDAYIYAPIRSRFNTRTCVIYKAVLLSGGDLFDVIRFHNTNEIYLGDVNNDSQLIITCVDDHNNPPQYTHVIDDSVKVDSVCASLRDNESANWVPRRDVLIHDANTNKAYHYYNMYGPEVWGSVVKTEVTKFNDYTSYSWTYSASKRMFYVTMWSGDDLYIATGIDGVSEITWSDPVLVETIVNGVGRVQILYNDHTSYLTCVIQNSDGHIDITTSPDDGATWVTTHGGASDNGKLGATRISGYGSGYMIAQLVAPVSDANNIVFLSVKPDGTFVSQTALSNGESANYKPCMLIDNSHTRHIAYYDVASTKVKIIHSSDGGTWSSWE